MSKNVISIERVLSKGKRRPVTLNGFRESVRIYGMLTSIKNLFRDERRVTEQAIAKLHTQALLEKQETIRNYLIFTAEFLILQHPFYLLFDKKILEKSKIRLLEHNFPFTDEEK